MIMLSTAYPLEGHIGSRLFPPWLSYLAHAERLLLLRIEAVKAAWDTIDIQSGGEKPTGKADYGAIRVYA